MSASGEGLQVLSVEQNSSGRSHFRCSEDALRRVTQAPAARGLPVAVVSVAGATRGGKSFLLDFFLRYLRAPPAARRSGAWIGADDEPLTGFSWRTGPDRHTEGITIWSEPIVVDTYGPDGRNQRVAVILLDTQGSFDCNSTVRDSSTVFAVSTLLSSVQIYNLSKNIKEDDLQYLHLFTEYGRFARVENDAILFQELRFLVRDWSWAYRYPYGAEGGQRLLDARLEIRNDQAPELREVREHIRGTFERVRAFLMPHPGQDADTNPNFRGCLIDISAEFKERLLELVPSLFAPEYLTIKKINGQQVILEDFVEYFTTYVDLFNSESIPSPTTFLQASRTASLEAALRASRDEYRAHMQRCARGAMCVSRQMIPIHHASALLAARRVFVARRTFATPAVAQSRLADLLQELEDSLADRVSVNNGRIAETVTRCKEIYETTMRTTKCLAPVYLTEQHHISVAAARNAFEDAFMQHDVDNSNEEDDFIENDHVNNTEDWESLRRDLQDLLPLHRERNEERIEAAKTHALETYLRLMRAGVSIAPCLHPNSLSSLNRTSFGAAATDFESFWLDQTISEHHNERFNSLMSQQYQGFVDSNRATNQIAINNAFSIYENTMADQCYDGDFYLHPRELQRTDDRAQESADEHFLEQRDPDSRNAPVDEFRTSLYSRMSQSRQRFVQRNENMNEEAVNICHEYYTSKICPGRATYQEMMDWLGPPDYTVFIRHPNEKQEAINKFLQKRTPNVRWVYNEDKHLDNLESKIELTFQWVTMKILAQTATFAAAFYATGGANAKL